MKRIKGLRGLAFLMTAATTLTACGGSSGVQFWSSFGAAYKGALDTMCEMVTKKTGVKIAHESKGSYPEIRRQMISAIAAGDYPSLAVGYPDHIVSYLASNILKPLDEYVKGSAKSDYYANYLEEDVFYDNSGKGVQRLYGVPFNKSTEILGYNGVFVDYCASIDASLATVPTTWQGWADKGPAYMDIYNGLVGKVLYGKLGADGHASDFAFAKGTELSKLLDFTNVVSGKNYLMAYDATDNAFITFLRQWGAEYTVLPDAEAKKPAGRRVGQVKFTGGENLNKAVTMFKFFRNLYKQRIFCIPGTLGADYASKPFKQCQVMFMICSSGGLSHNTTEAEFGFSVAPVPYFDDGENARKYVIAQGANLCLTDAGNTEDAVKVLKALTTGEIQAQWCLQTGYFPGSKSAYETKAYQDFLKSTDTKSPLKTVYRAAAKLNSTIYTNTEEGWHNFVDPAFVGSAILREKLTGLLKAAFALTDAQAESDSNYKKIITSLKDNSDLKIQTIQFA